MCMGIIPPGLGVGKGLAVLSVRC